jgi:tetratricopeptide (TPR) repeat protein
MNSFPRLLQAFLALLLMWTLLPLADARAADEGQADLDRAVEIQLSATETREFSLSDMERIADLCESAITKGLSDDNKLIAVKLLTSTLFLHAERLSNVIFAPDLFEVCQPHPQWQRVRALAIRDLDRVLKYDDNLPQAHLLLARLYAFSDGDREKAAASIGKAIDQFKDDKPAQARALVIRGLFVEQAPEKQLEQFTKAMEVDPESKHALRARGLAYLRANQPEKAAEDFTKLLEGDKDNLPLLGHLTDALLNQKKFDEAIKIVDRIIAARPMITAGYLARARVHTLAEDNKAALEDYNKALEVQPNDLAALLLRAEFLYKEKKYDAAKADVEKALAAQPNLVQAILMKAALAAEQGKFDEAIAAIQPFADAQPLNPQWRLQIAQFYSAGRRPRKAIETVNLVLKNDSDNSAALRIRGDAYLSIGKHAEAIKDLEAALAEEPKNSGILNNLAWVLSTSPEDGVRNGKRSIELALQACEVTEYKRPHIISTLAAAYAESGDWENAVKWSTKAVEMSDESEKEILDQLKDELKHYQEKKPFREKQEIKENEDKPKTPATDLEA